MKEQKLTVEVTGGMDGRTQWRDTRKRAVAHLVEHELIKLSYPA